MVHDDQQQMLVLGEPDEPGANQGQSGEIEWFLRGFLQALLRAHFTIAIRQLRQINERRLYLEAPLDDLDWRSVNRGETSAQGFMAVNHRLQSLLECENFQPAFQAQGGCHVVGGTAWFELIDEPEPLLRKRQGSGGSRSPARNRLGRHRRLERVLEA